MNRAYILKLSVLMFILINAVIKTSTTSTTSLNPTSTINVNQIFSCDFDANDNCGGVLSSNNSGLFNTFQGGAQSAVMVTTTATDITSISK